MNTFLKVLQVVLMAATPMFERITPLYAYNLGFSAPLAVGLFVMGNMLPVIPVMLLIAPLSQGLDRIPFCHRFFVWLFAKCRHHQSKIDKYGFWGLTLFAAIPSPLTGTWSGAVLAYLMGIRKRVAFPALMLGAIIAGAILTASIYGGLRLFGVR